MFVIAKHKSSSQVIFQRVPHHDVAAMKIKGVAVFDDERMAEYAACYINAMQPGTWEQNIHKHGHFVYDIKHKKELYIAHDPNEFNRLWVAFMVTDLSFQLRSRGVNSKHFLLQSLPQDIPLTPWVIIKLSSDCFFIVSTSDGRVVGTSHSNAHGDFNALVNSIGGGLCGAHLEVLTLKELT